MNQEFKDVLVLIEVLFAVVVSYIIAGTAEGVLVNNEAFDPKKLGRGILKAITACGSLIVISYAFTVVDLHNLGFYPNTVITSGIAVYTTKLIIKAMQLLGLKFPKSGDKNNVEEAEIDELLRSRLNKLDEAAKDAGVENEEEGDAEPIDPNAVE
jgi:hypothetical protein